MKIYGNRPGGINDGVNQTKQGGAKKGGGLDFSQLLNGSLEAGRPKAAGPPPPLSPLNPLQQAAPVDQGRQQAAGAGSDTLALLEHLSSLLAGPEVSEGALEEMANALEGKAEELMAVRDSLGQDDPLRHQVNEIGILSAVEAYKIKRGDYS